jgi:hypothetical protein
MTQDKMVTVYLFSRIENGREIAPRHMWGTLEAIATLADCAPVMESARAVSEAALENGFLFRRPDTVSIHIDEPPPGY